MNTTVDTSGPRFESALIPLSRTATPTPDPVYPYAHTAGALILAVVVANLRFTWRSTDTYFTAESLSRAERLEAGNWYTPCRRFENSLTIVPPKFLILDEVSSPTEIFHWMTTRVAFDGLVAAASGEIFERCCASAPEHTSENSSKAEAARFILCSPYSSKVV